MLAHLLRRLYLFQVLGGALLGSYLAVRHSAAGSATALWWIPLLAIVLPLVLQFLVIATSMVRSCADGYSSFWWRAFWGEFQAALTVFVLRMPWAGKPPGVLLPTAAAATGVNAPPVLLVHGYICNHRVWDDLVTALRQAGHPVLTLDLEPLFTSIDDYAPLIDNAITTLLARTGGPKVALVGHSMGGLAIRAWLRAYGSGRVARIITLGTPHQGTRLARGAMTANGIQMNWHSPWLASLADSEGPHQRALMHIALTAQDNIVYPQREQVLPGAQATVFQGLGHLELCLDTRVIQWVRQTLETSGPVTAN
ncbi:alpha/beta fold hydrolase [Rhodoferax sp.]|uniref:esterase/lipase family protein n=1 Tax=Rhodoferax sp. TaxID=50421 RepID=UPI0026166B20|nr:alpha/beta fold hydrolase [Rhodoferax sp.]MDD2925112.1 alpha/beta fold hydrolase [Rhodoferax sp.]